MTLALLTLLLWQTPLTIQPQPNRVPWFPISTVPYADAQQHLCFAGSIGMQDATSTAVYPLTSCATAAGIAAAKADPVIGPWLAANLPNPVPEN